MNTPQSLIPAVRDLVAQGRTNEEIVLLIEAALHEVRGDAITRVSEAVPGHTRVQTQMGDYYVDAIDGVWIVTDETNEECYRTTAGLDAAIEAIREVTEEMMVA